MYQRQSNFKKAISLYRRAIPKARRTGDQFVLARIFTNLGYLYTERGYWLRAEILCYRALEIFKQIDNLYGLAHTENHLGILYTRQGLWDQAEDHLTQAMSIWRASGDQHGLVRGCINFSLLYLSCELPEQALAYLDQARCQAEATNNMAEIGVIYTNMAYAYQQQGDLIRAEILNRKAEDIYYQQANLEGLARVWTNLGVVYTKRGDWAAAASYLDKSLQMQRDLGNRRGEIETLLDFVAYEVARGANHKAIKLLLEAENLIKIIAFDKQHNLYQTRLERYRHSLNTPQGLQAAADELPTD
jgi:tetratricopeptide (TPR) repeat protein